ncbi:hypothetical protein FRC05_002797 [Tulasnella sp. 425]|nr:hypothetical protein FRC05_002797 [Tulasnella sp. 425]
MDPSLGEEYVKKIAYVKADDSLLISSTRHRTQAENVEDCLRKLHTLILDASSAEITNDPTAEQQQRVKDLQKAHSNRLKREKQGRSAGYTLRSYCVSGPRWWINNL